VDFRGIIAPLTRPPALAGLACFAFGMAIAANALFLQPRPHPAPFVSTLTDADAGQAHPDEVVLAVQAALRDNGHYSGGLDGLAGEETRSAILAFERAVGREATGKATLELLAEIRSAGHGANASHAGAGDAPQPDSRVAEVQAALARSAYGPLTADGIFGPQTGDAIIRFQRDHGLPVTGEISDALVVELRSIGALDDE